MGDSAFEIRETGSITDVAVSEGVFGVVKITEICNSVCSMVHACMMIRRLVNSNCCIEGKKLSGSMELAG